MYPCVILCGGLATRLGPLAERTPKSLVPIRGEPFLAHQFRLLRSRGIERVVLCVGHLGEQIRDFAGDGSAFGLRVACSFDGPEPLGTAGAIRNALPLLEGPFFVLYGDSYLPCDHRRVATAFRSAGKPGLMTIYRNEGQFDTSNVEAAGGSILRYDKRTPSPAMRYIDYGLSVFERGVFESAGAPAPRDLTEVFTHLLVRGALAACEVHERFYEIGSPRGIEDLTELLGQAMGAKDAGS